MKTPPEIINDIEMLSVHYAGRYSLDTRQILERRWQAYKFVTMGIHTVGENRQALKLMERLMDISNSKHENEKDTWLLNQLADVIQEFESKTYK